MIHSIVFLNTKLHSPVIYRTEHFQEKYRTILVRILYCKVSMETAAIDDLVLLEENLKILNRKFIL